MGPANAAGTAAGTISPAFWPPSAVGPPAIDALRAGLRRVARRSRARAHSETAVTYPAASKASHLPWADRLNALFACHIIDINECALAENVGKYLMNTHYIQ